MTEVARFAFGRNWQGYLGHVNDERLRIAEESVRKLLKVDNLENLRFLDIGSGSGLFSLAALRLGASVVHSFDYDENSVEATCELRRRFAPTSTGWSVERGDVLDPAYLATLGTWDVVYAWGVLHHTGDMWRAIENASGLVAPRGRLALAIYNDQGPWSVRWTIIKRSYVRAGPVGKTGLLAGTLAAFTLRSLFRRLLPGGGPSGSIVTPGPRRGMTRLVALRDWVGGYPFEAASPAAVFTFLHDRGFTLQALTTVAGEHGNNEYLFQRAAV